MADFFREIWQFISAVVQKWQGYMTGGLIMALLAIYQYAGGNVPPRYVWIGVAAFFIVAAYMAWRDKHRALRSSEMNLTEVRAELDEALKRRVPELHGRITFASFGNLNGNPNDAVLSLYVSISNTGMDSVATEYLLSVDLPSGDTLNEAPTHFPAPVVLGREGRSGVTITPDSAIYIKTIQPIPTGGMVEGTLIFILPGVPQSVLMQVKRTIKVSFADVTRTRHSIIYELNDGDTEPPLQPGIGMNITPPQPPLKVRRAKKKPRRPRT